ncbi:unnamed protein product [Musa textilis]
MSSSLELSLESSSSVLSVKSFLSFGRWFSCSSCAKKVISYVINEPMSSSNRKLFKTFASCIVVTFESQFLGRERKILLISSRFEKDLPSAFKLLTTSRNRVYMSPIVLIGSIRNNSKSCTKKLNFESFTLLVPSCVISSVSNVMRSFANRNPIKFVFV